MNNKIERQKFITRADLRARPDAYFLFGDNLMGVGRGGQAAEMRGEPNAIGIPTKVAPHNAACAFFTDEKFSDNCMVIDAAILRIPNGCTVVIPEGGLGTGLAELPTRAPKTYAFLCSRLAALEDS